MEDKGPGVHPEGLAIWMPVSGEKLGTVHDWTFNNRFKCISGKKYFCTKTGALKFPKNHEYFPNKYLTGLGWRFAHGGLIYDKDNRNMQAALSRHFKLKKPDNKIDQDEVGNLLKYGIVVNNTNFDNLLSANNHTWYRAHTRKFVDEVLSQIGEHEYHFDLREASVLLSKDVHTKRLLREDQINKFLLDGLWCTDKWTKYLEWKIKFLEVAKYKKDPRIIVDATVANSLPRVHFANSWKKFSSDKEIIFGDVRVIFRSSPNPQDLSLVFEEAFSSQYTVQIINYSDDSILTIKKANGSLEIYNVDISSNDSSHTWDTFECYAAMSNMCKEQRDNLFQVISTPFKVVSSSGAEFAVFKSITGYLPSGIGDTTVCNNAIYVMLAYCYDFLLKQGYVNEISLLTLAGFIMGFRFSYQLAERPEEMQFLKNSPIIRDGVFHSVPNLGIMFRYSGYIEGNLPKDRIYPAHIKSFEQKAAFFQSLLTFGFFKYYRYKPLLDALCPYFDYLSGHESEHMSEMSKLRYSDLTNLDGKLVREPITLTREEMYSRYALEMSEIDQFELLLLEHGFGMCINCPVVDKVLEADYGLKW